MSEQLPGVLVPGPHLEQPERRGWLVAWVWCVRAGVFEGWGAGGLERAQYGEGSALETGKGLETVLPLVHPPDPGTRRKGGLRTRGPAAS